MSGIVFCLLESGAIVLTAMMMTWKWEGIDEELAIFDWVWDTCAGAALMRS